MHDTRLFCRSGELTRADGSVRRDRCEDTRGATRSGLIRHVGGSAGHGPVAYGPDGMRPRATVRNTAPSGQLVGS